MKNASEDTKAKILSEMGAGFSGVNSASSASACAAKILPAGRVTFQIENEDVASGLNLLVQVAQGVAGSSSPQAKEESKPAGGAQASAAQAGQPMKSPAKGFGAAVGLSDLRSARNLMYCEQEKELDSLTNKLKIAVGKVAECLDAAVSFQLDGQDEFQLCAERMEAALLWLNCDASLQDKNDEHGNAVKGADGTIIKERVWTRLVNIELADTKKESRSIPLSHSFLTAPRLFEVLPETIPPGWLLVFAWVGVV